MKNKFFKRKEIFLKGEGDNWYFRNKNSLRNRYHIKKNKIIINIIKKIKKEKKISILEVGCSNGLFITQLKKKIKNCEAYGIDPSERAVNDGKKNKLNLFVGTADNLIFPNNSIDIIFYSFCLYLCDPSDYKKINNNAKRVLKMNGHVIIFDFFYNKIINKIYKHDKRIFIIKRDFRKIFHKNFSCVTHKLYNYSEMFGLKKKYNDHLSISLMKKKSI